MPAEVGFTILVNNFGNEDAKRIEVYEKLGGYQALRKALRMEPAALVAEVKASNLRGRGGAGFPTGVKWGFLPPDRTQTYLVANADESEPGTCKDRELIYWDPHQFIEGFIISAFAIGAHGHNYIYIRGEMMREYAVLGADRNSRRRTSAAISVTGRVGIADLRAIITVHRGAGAYICGEETVASQLTRGHCAVWPRLKPPFPAIKGLFGQPTIVNNVETLCNVPVHC